LRRLPTKSAQLLINVFITPDGPCVLLSHQPKTGGSNTMSSTALRTREHLAGIRNGPMLLRSGCADAILSALRDGEKVTYILNDCSTFIDRFELRTNTRNIAAIKRPLMRCRITLSAFVPFPVSPTHPERPAPSTLVVDTTGDVSPLTPPAPRRTEPKPDHGRHLPAPQQSKRQRRRSQEKSK
jgi:hypothetical protein